MITKTQLALASEQEIWDAAIRSWRDLHPAPAAQTPSDERALLNEMSNCLEKAWAGENHLLMKARLKTCVERVRALAAVPAAEGEPSNYYADRDAAITDTSKTVYLIVFDDTERPPEMVVGDLRARHVFGERSQSWNAHLFGKIKSNSRDDERYSDNIVLAASAPSAQAPAQSFERGSWQHAVDDELVNFGRTSQEFATPHEALAWLGKVTRQLGRDVPDAQAPAQAVQPEANICRLLDELERGAMEGHSWTRHSKRFTTSRDVPNAASKPIEAAWASRPLPQPAALDAARDRYKRAAELVVCEYLQNATAKL